LKGDKIMDVYEYAKKHKLTGRSAINQEEFREFFKGIKIKTVVEIGTFKGISAAYMKQFCSKVFTFDIEDYPQKYKVWKDLKIDGRIFFSIIENRQQIKEILDKIKWDFAFIDGSHTWEDARMDWELVNKCGKVLFHDVNKKAFAGVRKFVDSIEAKIIGPIAYWTK
jgi:predicted O-methyltransferase YrrM